LILQNINDTPFYHLTTADTLQRLESSPHGISTAEAQKRLLQFGSNELLEKKEKSWWVLLLSQFSDFMIIVLLAAAVISGFIGDITDTIIIIILVLINAILGFSQEYRARNAVKALKKMAALNATVLRGNMVHVVPANELVPGDVILLEAGNVVPADSRLIETSLLTIQESSLTGEATESEKESKPLTNKGAALGDRFNMAYKGTSITKGNGKGVVTATGMQTELGKIAELLQAEETKTPLQRKMEQFSRQLSVIILIICAIIFIVGWLRGEQPILMLLTAISLAVAAIPEALPSVITIALSFGAKKMARQNALIKKLPAVETLGAVTFICTDKTGTLTQNKMQAIKMYCKGKLYDVKNNTGKSPCNDEWLFIISALNNTVLKKSENEIIGDSTELALYHFALQNNYHKEELLHRFPLVHILPFDAERKCMTTIHKYNNAFISFTKGGPDVILAKTNFQDYEDEMNVQEAVDEMASEGLRIIALGYREWKELPSVLAFDMIESGLTFVALIGIADPLRPESRTAVQLCKAAGIKPIMVTGDHALTANIIAKQTGIIEDSEDLLLTSKQLDETTDKILIDKIEHIKTFARVTPGQKLRIVKTLQQKGEFVAMTGDGVNDAPALQLANIGIAMGINGTDVSKEAADMILLDDNFSTIVKAVKEGRRIFDNIRKFIRYVMTGNAGEVWTIFLAPFFGLPVPLLPIHILWINLVTDGLPGLALASERSEKGIMERPPRPTNENIFSNGMGWQILWAGFLMGVVCITTQAIALNNNSAHWQTMVFTVLCFSQLGNVMAVRSETRSLFKLGVMSNKFMFYAIAITVALQFAIIYVPALNKIFRTQPLTTNELLLTILLSTVIFWAIEIEKLVRRYGKVINKKI